MLEELHTPQYWLENIPEFRAAEFRAAKKPMQHESVAHRAIAVTEAVWFSIQQFKENHQEFEYVARRAREQIGYRTPGLRHGVDPEVLTMRAMQTVSSIWVPYILDGRTD